MENAFKSHRIFQIVFNNKVIQIDYDRSIPENKKITVESLIKSVLDKCSPNNNSKNISKYDLFCSCGNKIDLSGLLDNNLCDHKFVEMNNKKQLNERYLLIENQSNEHLREIQENEKELTANDIDKIFELKKNVRPKKKKNKQEKGNKEKEDLIDSKKTFIITEEFKQKLNKYIIKFERAKKILSSGYSVFYNEEYLVLLLSMGIENNKAKSALRFSNNNLEVATLIATDERFAWEGRNYLSYDNDELMTKDRIDENLKAEIKKEYPFLKDENQINDRAKEILDLLVKDNSSDNIEHRNIIFIGCNDDDDDDDYDGDA
jgi:hypothetical protein